MKSKRVGHGHMKWAVCSALLSASTLAAAAPPREISADAIARLASLSLPEVITIEGVQPTRLHPSLAGLTGRHEVMVRLRGESVAASGQRVTRDQVLAEQAAFINRALAAAPSTNVVASVQLALNAVILNVDAVDLPALARDTSITRIVGVSNYSQDLSETVPYIGASAAHDYGAKGHGVRIAVIDSGVDYTHQALGGPGTQAAYEAAWAPIPVAPAPAIPELTSGGYLVADDPTTKADDGLFPSDKVIGGYDFVGERWPNSPGAVLEPDPDPIGAPDATTNGGHGTHVADIIAGKLGVAHKAKLYALKACSAPATSCSGTALIRSMEFALDPNGDGDIADRVDIINMSLGSIYGQPFDDDLSAAVDAAAMVNVLTVASAGNSADKQFITGSPAAASSALSVAQTAVPSATLQLMTLLAPITGDRGAVFQPWSVPLTSTIEGLVLYPPVAGGKRVGCADAAGANPYAAGELAGRIVLVDRGVCSFSLKIANIAAAGGTLGIIGLITPDVPFGGAFGGGDQTIPGYMINQVDANVLRAGNAVVRFSPSGNVSLAGSLASTSSRGPRFDDNIVKPEIGAPGASISADSGSFTGTSAFGGTSGAAPMVAGAAAILKSSYPGLTAREIKQLLINTADPNVRQPSAGGSVFPDQLAPITRIGGGEVRVDRALVSPIIVRDSTGDAVSRIWGAMSFGYLDASKPSTTFTRKLSVRNTTSKSKSYTVTPTLRYQDDKDNGAVTIGVSASSIVVPARGTREVTVTLHVDGTRLRGNAMSAGAGNAIGPLTLNEYDGYITFQGADHKASMPWHILPRKSAEVTAPDVKLVFTAPAFTMAVPLTNSGVGNAQIYAYSMLATGTDRPGGGAGQQTPNPDLRAVATNTVIVPAGVCGATQNFVWEFAFNMHERKANPAGTWHEVDLDVNNDGTTDFFVINQDVGGVTQLSDGRQVTAVINAATNVGTLRFLAEHATNTANVILRVCGSDLGLTMASIGQPMVADFRATSWYFGGDESHLGPFLITPLGEEFTASVPGDLIGPMSSGTLTVQEWGLFPGTDSYEGVLLINNSDFGANARGGATAATEATLLFR
jgi:minor extracellular serine protease Vpr